VNGAGDSTRGAETGIGIEVDHSSETAGVGGSALLVLRSEKERGPDATRMEGARCPISSMCGSAMLWRADGTLDAVPGRRRQSGSEKKCVVVCVVVTTCVVVVVSETSTGEP
jgi:hypothetical protein